MTGYQRLKRILQSDADQTPVLIDEPGVPSLEHDNVRGMAYYN